MLVSNIDSFRHSVSFYPTKNVFQLYDCKDSSILVNDIVEVVGFLSLKRAVEPMEDGDNEYVASLPVIHVIHTTVGRSPFDSMLTLHKGVCVFASVLPQLRVSNFRYSRRAYFSKCGISSR